MTFAQRYRELRQQKGLGLREVARRGGLDASNLSRLERGVMPPPQDPDAFRAYVDPLQPTPAERRELETLATLQTGRLPRRLSDDALVQKVLELLDGFVLNPHVEDATDDPQTEKSTPSTTRSGHGKRERKQPSRRRDR